MGTSALQPSDFFFVNVDAGYVYAHLGEACAGYQSDIAGSYNCDIHLMEILRSFGWFAVAKVRKTRDFCVTLQSDNEKFTNIT